LRLCEKKVQFFAGRLPSQIGRGAEAFSSNKKTMKTTFTMIAAMVAFTAGAIAAPAVTTAPAKVGAVAESKTVTLEVTGLR
jgi:hypothetical protein